MSESRSQGKLLKDAELKDIDAVIKEENTKHYMKPT